jgi:hypothetical protein
LVRGDSKLVLNQDMKAMEPCNPQMCVYYNGVCKLEEKFKGFELHHNYRCFNAEANELSAITLGRKPVLDGVFTSDLYEPSVKIKQQEEESSKVTDDQVTPTAQAGGGHNDQSAGLTLALYRSTIRRYPVRGLNRSQATISQSKVLRAHRWGTLQEEHLRHQAEVSHSRKDDNCLLRCTEEHMGTTQPHGPSLSKHSDNASIGPRSWPTPNRSSKCEGC